MEFQTGILGGGCKVLENKDLRRKATTARWREAWKLTASPLWETLKYFIVHALDPTNVKQTNDNGFSAER